MRYSPLRISMLSLCLCFLHAQGTDYASKAPPPPGKKQYKGIVLVAPTKVFVQPSFRARALFTLKLDDTVSIVAQTKKWYGVRLYTSQGSILAGWVEKAALKVIVESSRRSPPPMIRRPELSRPGSAPLPTAQTRGSIAKRPQQVGQVSPHKNEIGLLAAPVYDAYKFGVNQKRVGMFYTRRLMTKISLDVPISYTFGGGGFNSMQVGVGGLFHMVQWSKVDVFLRLTTLGERFYNDEKHFYAVTADFGAGVRWFPTKSFGLSLEPISIETMFLTTEQIPFNIRAQPLLRLMVTW